MHKTWSMARALNGKRTAIRIPTLQDSSGEANDSLQKANILGITFSRVSNNLNYSNRFMQRKRYFESNTFRLYSDFIYRNGGASKFICFLPTKYLLLFCVSFIFANCLDVGSSSSRWPATVCVHKNISSM